MLTAGHQSPMSVEGERPVSPESPPMSVEAQLVSQVPCHSSSESDSSCLKLDAHPSHVVKLHVNQLFLYAPFCNVSHHCLVIEIVIITIVINQNHSYHDHSVTTILMIRIIGGEAEHDGIIVIVIMNVAIVIVVLFAMIIFT